MPLVWLSVDYFGWLSSVEYTTLNWRFRSRGEIEAPIKLMYVDLDSDAVKMLGERPIPRIHFARAIHGLFQYGGARTVGLDVIFSATAQSALVDKRKVRKDNAAFRDVILSSPGLVLGAGYAKTSSNSKDDEVHGTFGFPYIYMGNIDPALNEEPEKPAFGLIGKDKGNLGLINVAYQYSPGSTPRWLPLFVDTPERRYLSLGLEMLRVYYGVEMEDVHVSKEEIIFKGERGRNLLRIPLTESQMLEVNWFSPWISNTNPRVSLKSVVEAVEWVEQGDLSQRQKGLNYLKQFEGSVILIGAVDPLLNDIRPEPFTISPVPKVGVHGNLIKTIASGKYLIRPSYLTQTLLTLLITGIAVGLVVVSGKRSSICKVGSFFLLNVYGASCFYLFNEFQLVLPMVVPLISAFTTAFLVILLQLFYTEKQRGRVEDLFGNYLSRSVVDEIVKKDQLPKLGGVEQNITAFFSDIENFSAISERVDPAELVEFLNEYLTCMTKIIHDEGGTLDKYVGDGIVAIFGAPLVMEDHALRACRAACKFYHAQIELCNKWRMNGRMWPEEVFKMRTRVGINTGSAIIGNMGSYNRFNYTMMGENVNIASRCEGVATEYGIYSIVSACTRKATEALDSGIVFRFLDRVSFKGHGTPVDIHEVVGFRDELSKEALDCVDLYESALECYFLRQWEKAIMLLDESEALEMYLPQQSATSLIRPSSVFLNRCQILKETPPPEDWNGVFDQMLFRRVRVWDVPIH